MKNKAVENDEVITDFCWSCFAVLDEGFVGALRSVVRNFINLKAIVLSWGNFRMVACNLTQFIAFAIHFLGVYACFSFVRLVLTGLFFILGGNLL